MYTLGQEHFQDEARQPEPIQFTSGAVQVINRKGEVSMQKVHVKRYIAGKRPEYAGDDSSSEDEDGFQRGGVEEKVHGGHLRRGEDRRLARLEEMDDEEVDVEERIRRRRHREPEVIEESEDEDAKEEIPKRRVHQPIQLEEESDDEDLNEQQMEERRMMRRLRARARVNQDEELLQVKEEEEQMEIKEESDDEEEEETDSEEEDSDDEDARLKPVFVRKKDRLTIQEREKEQQRMEELAVESKKVAEQRKRETIRLIEAERRAELQRKEASNEAQLIQARLDELEDEDEGDDEAEYEKWKLRELKRVKRDREEREQMQKEREEIEKMAKMTEEERIQMNRMNPKKITNKKEKGKMKYLQKYYHRGAFFMEKEEEVFTRDFAQPTLDDHFDKLVLPKVMQVKNFGRSGRTKYTHLVDQDTTSFDSPWAVGNSSTSVATKGKPRKQEFQRPSSKKQN